MKREIQIDVLDLLKEILRGWKMMVIAGVICALIIPTIVYVDQKKYVGQVDSEVVLSESEQALVDRYLFSKESYEKYKEYVEGSIFYNMDHYNAEYITQQYHVKGAEDVIDSVLAIRNYIENGGLVADLGQDKYALNSDYLQEIIICEGVDYGSNDRRTSGVFSVKIYGRDKEMCEAMASDVNNLLHSFVNTNANVLMCEEIVLLEQSYYKGFDSYVGSFRTGQRNTLKAQQDEIATVSAMLSSNQWTIINGGTITVQEVSWFNTSYISLSFILGVIVSVAILVAKYILNDAIKTEREIERLYNISLLGVVGKGKKDFSVSRIVTYLKNKNYSVAVVGETNLCKNVYELLKTTNYTKAICVGDIINDVKSMEMLVNNKNVLLVIEKKKTKHVYIEQLVKMCKLHNIEIEGYVVVE